jgi:ParB/RepB/Spo0J family partition protein
MTELIYLPHAQLKLHPQNIRLYYPPQDVAEMAGSLASVGQTQQSGNLLAMLVVPADEPGFHYVVDGNLRLAAGRTLGEDCPPFKCEVITQDKAAQLLTMAALNLHYPKDPVSEGRHYDRLIREEGYTQEAIAAATGLSRATISSRLALLDLDEEIQGFIVERRLPADIRLIRALRNMPDTEQRLRIARYYAGRKDVAIGSMVRRIRKISELAHELAGKGSDYRAAEARRRDKTRAANEARRSNRQTGLDEVARAEIWRLAGVHLCEGCRLDGLEAGCYLCPGPQEFIEHLVELAEVGQGQAFPVANGAK